MAFGGAGASDREGILPKLSPRFCRIGLFRAGFFMKSLQNPPSAQGTRGVFLTWEPEWDQTLREVVERSVLFAKKPPTGRRVWMRDHTKVLRVKPPGKG
jgi:hypothetical protein